MDFSAIFLLSGHQIIRALSFMVVAYFTVQLYRRRIEGSALILGGAVAVLVGDGARAAGYLGGETAWLWSAGAGVAAVGFAVGAYGFSKLARAAMARANGRP